MKNLKGLVTTIFLFAVVLVQAQKVELNGVDYVVKKNAILVDKVDVTSTLSPEMQASIKNRLNAQILAEKRLAEAKKAQKAAEKAQKKAKKKQKAADKELKKAEKKLKNKEKAKARYEVAKKDLEKNIEKHQKLQEKGKLSPQDEIKWQKKLEKSRNKIEKPIKKIYLNYYMIFMKWKQTKNHI